MLILIKATRVKLYMYVVASQNYVNIIIEIFIMDSLFSPFQR